EESVSENTPDIADSEETLPPEYIAGAGEALGEPPLIQEDGTAGGIRLYNNEVMSTTSAGTTVQTPSTTDIIARYKDYSWSLSAANTYSVRPSTKKPYEAGHLSDVSLHNTLDLLNFIRYVAGVPADVTLNEDYTNLAQAGTLLNCVNGQLTHTPGRPSGFTEEDNDLYEKGKAGCGSSNIAYNYGNLAKSLLNGWMYDGDAGNISAMGHRRWVLNPSMTQTGFGAVGAYSAMYAFDRKGSSITDYVAWPARNMPIELMNGHGTPWTLSLGSDYKEAEQGQVVVTLKNAASGKTWTFSEQRADGYFAVNTDRYGMPNCIIFRPNNFSYDKKSQFQVTVTGLKDKDGNAAAISYNVDFFSLSDTPKEVASVKLDTENLHLLLGDTTGKAQGTLHATIAPSNAADKTLTWESKQPETAIVDQSGIVTAVGVGETTVTVTTANGMQDACTVKVSSYTLTAEGIAPGEETDTYSLRFEMVGFDAPGSGKKLTVRDGEKDSADQVEWTSENEHVATVDADGTVTPVGVGEATIWAKIEKGLQILSCEVKVENAELPTMQIRADRPQMKKGEAGLLRAYLSPAGTTWENNTCNYIKWISDNGDAVVFEQIGTDGTIVRSGDTVSGNTVTVRAKAAGKATVTAQIVNDMGQPAAAGDGKELASCEIEVLAGAELPAEADRPHAIALTNIQKTLQEVELPEGWSWKDPDTSLAQFAGQRSKTFRAQYQPAGADIEPAEALLPVYFITLESISLRVEHTDAADGTQEVSVLKNGWEAECYVNYSFAEALEQYEEQFAEQNGRRLEDNACYKKQKQELLEQLERETVLTSSRPQTAAVGKNAAGKTILRAAAPGDMALKAQLKVGAKTFSASRKFTVAEDVEAAFAVSGIEHFEKAASGEGVPYRYEGELSAFPADAPKGINSKIVLTMAGVTKLTVKSGNGKVVTVKSSAVKADGMGTFEIPLAVRAAGTAEITVTGNDPAKTVRALTLVVTDACPGLSEETVTVNKQRTVGTAFCLYAAKDAKGTYYKITNVIFTDSEKGGQHSGKFILRAGGSVADGSRWNGSITAKEETKTGTYKLNLQVTVKAGDQEKRYELPFTVKVTSVKPKCTVKQKNKLNLFYQDTSSLLVFDTEEKIERVSLTGCDYQVKRGTGEEADAYLLAPYAGATLNSRRKGTLNIGLEGWRDLTVSFTVGVEKKAIKITPVTGTYTLYPNSGITTAKITVKNPETLPWQDMTVRKNSDQAKGNYTADLKKEEQAILLTGKNLNRADSFRLTLSLDSTGWAEPVNLTCNVKVNLKEPSIALEKKTLQLNANEAYMGYDAASTAVRWKSGGDILTDQGVRVSVYCDPKDAKAKALVAESKVIFAVDRKNGAYQVSARLNNKAAASGSYKYIVQAAKDGKIWRTPLALKVVNTAPDKAVKIAAKGSIDVLNRDGSFMTLTPALKAVNGSFVTAADENAAGGKEVTLTGRDAHLFRAVWSADGKTVELRAKENVTLVIKFQYMVTPILVIRNVCGDLEEMQTAPVKFKLKQGSVKVTASPKSALMYSGAYNGAEIDMNAVLKGADAPKIEKVVLAGNTDAFAYVYNKEGKGTLTMKGTGRAVKGKTYSLPLQVFFAERADNGKPVTVRVTVKVK
ncbi:MAG: Ig-like domain-containing protein, partial [Bacteroidales bacterium]|nr:Ig-like domain-containing protein [Bacteroidales bacterium]